MHLTRTVCLSVALTTVAAAALAQEENGWCRHKQMYAVPAPAQVAIDGKLTEWDLSGAIESYVMPETRENQNAQFALMYDAEALYIGAIVRDPTPLMNQRDPKTEGDLGWDGDAVQFRIGVDPARSYPATDATWLKEHDDSLVHLTLWNYTPRQEPVLVVQTGMGYNSTPGAAKFGVIPAGKFQAKYVMADDQRGYSFEYRIPWGTLTAKQPVKGGDVVAATMQVLWGRTGNEHIGVNGVTYDLQLPGGFAYQNAGVWGKVIFAKDGHLPKQLVNAGVPPEKPLPLAFAYDLPESSEVTLQLFNERNEVVRLLAGEAARLGGKNIERWDGLDTLGRPLPAGRYAWKGLYHQPITTQYVLSVENSGQPAYKTDENNGGWGGDHGYPCGISRVGDDLCLTWVTAEAGQGIIRVDAEGKKKWGTLRSANHLAGDAEVLYATTGFDDEQVPPSIAECHGIEILSVKDFRPLLFENGTKVIPPPAGGAGADNMVSGLCLAKDTLYAAYRKRNTVVSYDARKGTVKETWTVPAPGYLAVRPDGALVLISAGQLALLKDGKLATLATAPLDEPKGVTVDAAGTIYVANQGKLQTVALFSPEGKYLRSIGKAGGRPAVGKYDPEGMLQPKAIALDGKGRLWVTEAAEAPKRVSVWNVANGKLEKEFFGCAHYSAFIWMDREHPDEVYCDNVFWNVDLNKKSWSPKSTVWRAKGPNSPGLFGTHMNGFRMFTAKNGRQYGWGSDEHLGTVLSIREGDIMKPLLMFFWTYAAKPAIGFPLTADTTKYPDQGTYIWVDRNDDQLMQESEIVAAAGLSPECAKRYFRAFSCVDEDLNLWHARGAVNRPLRMLPDGRPEYDFSKPEITTVTETQFVDAAGALYTLTADDSEPARIGYGKWSPDGKLLWGFSGYANWPKAISYPSQKPGKLWGPTMLLGTAGDFTGFNTYFGVAHLYTTDGLFVSRIMKDVRVVAEKLDASVISCENFNGCLVKPKGMERYFFLAGDQDGRITEVLGLETVKRLPGGDYVISDEDAQKAAAAIAEYQAQLTQAQTLRIAKGGKPGLAAARAVTKTLDGKRMFEARAAYDETNLYVEYKVLSPVKLVNSSPDPTVLFKGGNLLDIQLAADPQADAKRKTPAPGDLRILVSRQNGKPVAVVFRPKVAGFKGAPTILTSPVASESFDAIEVCDRILVDYTEDAHRQEFTARVTVPLAVLGWTPKPGAAMKMDLGYIFGNTEGSKAMARCYWHNNGFSANVLNDVPSESRLEPAAWGEALIE